jgi:phosphoglucosamine mutase
LDKHSTGDGLVSALQVLQAIVRTGQSLSELMSGLDLYPQTLINVRLGAGQSWQEGGAVQALAKQVQAELGESGRILIRPSGTEPVVRVMVEARDATVAREAAERLAQALRSS